MIRFFLLLTLLTAPIAAHAQDDDKGYIVGLIEDNLSDVSRQVRLDGFAGALSSQATFDSLTIADAEGIWLTIEDVTLTWNRAALLRGAIDIDEISAGLIRLDRAPISEASNVPAAEATPFALPELPVSINLGKLDITRLELADSFLDEPFAAAVRGSAKLSGGEGETAVTITRLDGKTGTFEINGSYDNTSRNLGLNLSLQEGEGGIAARQLGIPGRPSVGLTVAGDAPLDDFEATLTLATAGEDRVNGNFQLKNSDQGSGFALALAGDVTPLFAPEYQEFFGPDVSLIVAGAQLPNGAMSLQKLDLKAQNITLNGTANLDPQGWPTMLNITGEIASQTGDIVLLPITGPKTFVQSAGLKIAFNDSVSDTWDTSFLIDSFDRPGVFIDALALTGGGTITPGAGNSEGAFHADLDYRASGLVLDDAGLTEAIGDTIGGNIVVSRAEAGATHIETLTLTGPGIEALAEATIAGPEGHFDTQSSIMLTVTDLSRFSTLSGQPLGGAGELGILLNTTPLDGLFNVIVAGTTTDLALGIAQLDPVLTGAGNISLAASRDTAGTRLDALSITTPAASVTADANINSTATSANFNVSLSDLRLSLPDVSGPANLRGTATRAGDGPVVFDVALKAPDADIATTGNVVIGTDGATITTDLTVALANLATYAPVVGRPIKGATNLAVSSTLQTAGMLFDADLSGTTRNLVIGVPQADALLAGNGVIAATLSRSSETEFALPKLSLATPAVTLTANGVGDLTGPLDAAFDLQLLRPDLLSPGLTSPLRAKGTATRDDTLITGIVVNVTGPGTTIDLDATVAAPDNDYAMTGALTANVANLRAYAGLAGMPISGGISARVNGRTLPDLSRLSADLDLQTDNIAIGNPSADALLRGRGTLQSQVSLQDGALSVPRLQLTLPNGSLSAKLDGRGGAGRGEFSANLRDINILTDTLSGPANASGTATLNSSGDWQVNANGSGPGGIAAQVSGTVSADQQLALTLNGTAPLGLANPFIEPRRLDGTANYDLTVNGPATLSAVSGSLDLGNARLSLPTFGLALSDITGGVRLNGETAQIGVSAALESGGRISVNGPINLAAPMQADIRTQLDQIVLKDPNLYETSINGAITLSGPLTGGARIAGLLDLGATEIQVPSSGIGALGDLPNVTHIGASAAVQQTRARAGATDVVETTTATRSGPDFPLDVTIRAASKIFIRGRGLDAELGGQLQLGGSTKNVLPVGQFNLVRGRINILQQRFELTEGSASMQGGFDPYLRLVATTEARTGTVINIIVEGSASAPDVTFQSVPELPQDEVLSQLIFGRDLQSISPLQAVQLAAAVGTLAGRGGGGIIDNFRQNIGLDDFDVTTDDAGNAAVRAGKYLSDNVYTDVTVSSDGSTEINLNLDITNDITAKGTAGADGETSIGIFFERDY